MTTLLRIFGFQIRVVCRFQLTDAVGKCHSCITIIHPIIPPFPSIDLFQPSPIVEEDGSPANAHHLHPSQPPFQGAIWLRQMPAFPSWSSVCVMGGSIITQSGPVGQCSKLIMATKSPSHCAETSLGSTERQRSNKIVKASWQNGSFGSTMS